jgi:hypothetical protein
MDWKKMSVAMTSVVLISLVVLFVTASSLVADTPLYTMRMEQASSKMNFLPTTVNGFTYTAENGVCVDLASEKYCGGQIVFCMTTPYDTYCETCGPETCEETCEGVTCDSCEQTCDNTCWGTCPATCPNTCVSCAVSCSGTCDTCLQTCPETCGDCYETRDPPCPP